MPEKTRKPESGQTRGASGGHGAGRKGEERAAAFLEQAGMSIIARNIRSPAGEIDIAALDGDTLVFVEVKAWTSFGMADLQYGVDLKKQRKIIETAKYFLCEHREYNGKAVRFDVVFVGGETVTHLAAAFMERV